MAEPGNESPTTAEEYMRLAWKQQTIDKLFFTAEENFRSAISLSPENVDAYYGLGLVLKAQGRKEDAIQAFEKVNELIGAGVLDDHGRSEMLHRLAVGHINWLQSGDWNLEKEIWRKGR